MSVLRFFFLLCVSASLFSQSTISTASNGSLAIFPINPHHRSSDIIAMFNTLFTNSLYTNNNQAQVAFQTTRNGLLINILSVTPATNKTLLLVSYWPSGGRNPPQPLYAILPVEQIVEVVYSNKAIPSGSTFASTVPGGVLSIFSEDMLQRSTDIVNMFTILNTQSPYKTSQSSVSLQTTLSGPFYGGSLNNGVIPKVQSIVFATASPSGGSACAPNGTLLLVTYQVGNQQPFYNIVVAPDQVYGMTYLPLTPL